MKEFLRFAWKAANKTLGTSAGELFWKFRHIFGCRDWADKYISKDSISHPHRQFLVDRISSYAPFRSVLEIGCASGPNLYLLSAKFPDAEFFGIDISDKAVETGNKWFNKSGFSNVRLFRAGADDLGRFPDKSIDIVFSDAVLIYVGPERIRKVAAEMARVARKAIVLNERHDGSKPFSYKNYWIYDYAGLFRPVAGECRTKITKFPEGVWPVEGWKEYGAVIEIDLRRDKDVSG